MIRTYKGVSVSVTATIRPLSIGVTQFSPTVEIECSDGDGMPALLMTTESFCSAEEAEEFGMEMARRWLDQDR